MTNYNPFFEINKLQSAVINGLTKSSTPPVDILETETKIQLAVYIPGVETDKVEVSTENNTLTVKANRAYSKPENANQLRLEGSFGTLERTFSVGQKYDLSKIEATFKNGVLYLNIPRAEASQFRKVEVKVN